MASRRWSEVVFSGEAAPAVLSRAVDRGTLRRLASGIYTGAIDSDPADVVRRHLWRILGHELPGAVVVDVCARAAGPVDGVLTVAHTRTRPLELPGLKIVPRRGAGPVAGDMKMPDQVWLSSIPRQLLDSLARPRGAAAAYVMGATKVEEWIDTLVQQQGEDGINQIRDQARELAPLLRRERELERLDALISAALTTGDASALRSERLAARAAGRPFDDRRTTAFEALAADLASRAPDIMPALPEDEPRRRLLPFYDAYFSNYIEGTEFTLDEAAGIVFDQVVPADRPEDAHDVSGTYEVVGDPDEMRRVPASCSEFEHLLLCRHARLMAARPDRQPGQYKAKANRAGTTVFVAPDLVVGTLHRGFEIGATLTSPFARAVYLMFVTTEVHPFADGNGRVARMMMNAELVAAGEVRIIIPTVYRANYLAALKGATHNEHFAALNAMLGFARRHTAQVDFSTRQTAEADLTRTNALRDASEAERAGIRLVLPSSLPEPST